MLLQKSSDFCKSLGGSFISMYSCDNPLYISPIYDGPKIWTSFVSPSP